MPDTPPNPLGGRLPPWQLVDRHPLTGGGILRRPVVPVRPVTPPRRAETHLRSPFNDTPEERRRRYASPDRLTPFLVLRTGPNDVGQVAQRRIAYGSPTLNLHGDGGIAGFELKHNQGYTISGEVANLGAGPCLFGLATLYILTGDELTANWRKPYGRWFDVIDFRVPKGRSVRFTFRRKWVATLCKGSLSDRISIILHVADMLGDDSAFVIDGDGDRHCIRQDFHLT